LAVAAVLAAVRWHALTAASKQKPLLVNLAGKPSRKPTERQLASMVPGCPLDETPVTCNNRYVTKEKDVALRQALLERATAYALRHGFADLSLRPLAEGIGTSARMLIHHFGSKEALLGLIVEQIEGQFLGLSEQLLAAGASPVEMIETLWQTFSQPALEPVLCSIFELWGHALIHPQGFERLLDNLVMDWVSRLAGAFMTNAALEPERAAVLAHLTVAMIEGLLLQRLSIGQTAGQELRIEAAFRHFVGWLECEIESNTEEKI
jgi:AcrR family transcriptional regulator